MPEIINHFFAGETTITPAPNGPIRMTSHNFFGGVSFNDREISPIDFKITFDFDTDVPASIGVMVGTNHTISVSVSGETQISSYQWYKNGTAIEGATSNSYELDSVTKSEVGDQYYVVVSDSYGNTQKSNTGTVAVYDALAITTDLAANTYVNTGDSVTLAPVVTGGVPALSYRWLKSAADAGVTTLDLTIQKADATANNGTYALAIADADGNEIQTATTTLTVYDTLSVAAIASTATAAEGSTVEIGPVEPTGGVSPYTYQWYKNGAVASNSSAQTAQYTSGALAASDNGAVYKCVVTDAIGNTASTGNVTVTVTSA